MFAGRCSAHFCGGGVATLRCGGGIIIFFTFEEEEGQQAPVRSINCGHALQTKQVLFFVHCLLWSCSRQPTWLHFGQHRLLIKVLVKVGLLLAVTGQNRPRNWQREM